VRENEFLGERWSHSVVDDESRDLVGSKRILRVIEIEVLSVLNRLVQIALRIALFFEEARVTKNIHTSSF
jgi:hypothetical protein